MTELEYLEELHRKATAGPWFLIAHSDGWSVQDRAEGAGRCVAEQYGKSPPDDGNTIAATRNALPDFIAAVRALQSTCGYLLNAKIDLETGCTKAVAIKTIEGGLNMARAALAPFMKEHG